MYGIGTQIFYEGLFEITAETNPGIWVLKSIEVKDFTGNVGSMTTEAGSITVIQPDTVGPVIDGNSLAVSQKEVKVGEAVTISLNLTDESNIQSAALEYRVPGTDQLQSLALQKNAITGLYETTLTISEAMTLGKWTLDNIKATDGIGNISTINSSAFDLSKGDFSVIVILDATAPVIDWNSLKVSKKEVKVGESVTVSLNITDESDIQTATLKYIVPGTTQVQTVSLQKNVTTGLYEATLQITAGVALGEWILSSIEATDLLGNINNVDNISFDLSKGYFSIVEDKPEIKRPVLNYSVYIQGEGWQNTVFEGELSGTTGNNTLLESIKINLSESGLTGSIQYRTHVQSLGWMNWVENGQLSGTEGQNKRLEAIEIKLTGEVAEKYDIYYRGYVQNFGWLDWAKNGQPAGTVRYGYRLEATEIRLVEKGQPAPGKTGVAFHDKATVGPSEETVLSTRNVTYVAKIVTKTNTIDSQPYGVKGFIKLGMSGDYFNQNVIATQEKVTQRGTFVYITQNGKGIGWVDKKALDVEKVLSTKTIQYAAKVVTKTNSIDTQPYGVEGFSKLGTSADLYNQKVIATQEKVTRRGTFVYITQNGKGIGWVDKKALDVEKVLSTKDVHYAAKVVTKTNSIDTLPYGVEGFTKLGMSANIYNQNIIATQEKVTRRGTFVYITQNGKGIGWMDKKGLVLEVALSSKSVHYGAKIITKTNSIDTLPYGLEGFEKIASSNDYYGKRVIASSETITRRGTFVLISLYGKELGWIDSRALEQEVILSEKDSSYVAKIVGKNNTIDTLPYGLSGFKTIGRTTDTNYYNKEVRVSKEIRTQRGTFALISLNGKEIGWVDKSALEY